MEYCKGYNSLALGIQEICVKISDSVFHTTSLTSWSQSKLMTNRMKKIRPCTFVVIAFYPRQIKLAFDKTDRYDEL